MAIIVVMTRFRTGI